MTGKAPDGGAAISKDPDMLARQPQVGFTTNASHFLKKVLNLMASESSFVVSFVINLFSSSENTKGRSSVSRSILTCTVSLLKIALSFIIDGSHFLVILF